MAGRHSTVDGDVAKAPSVHLPDGAVHWDPCQGTICPRLPVVGGPLLAHQQSDLQT